MHDNLFFCGESIPLLALMYLSLGVTAERG